MPRRSGARRGSGGSPGPRPARCSPLAMSWTICSSDRLFSGVSARNQTDQSASSASCRTMGSAIAERPAERRVGSAESADGAQGHHRRPAGRDRRRSGQEPTERRLRCTARRRGRGRRRSPGRRAGAGSTRTSSAPPSLPPRPASAIPAPPGPGLGPDEARDAPTPSRASKTQGHDRRPAVVVRECAIASTSPAGAGSQPVGNPRNSPLKLARHRPLGPVATWIGRGFRVGIEREDLGER